MVSCFHLRISDRADLASIDGQTLGRALVADIDLVGAMCADCALIKHMEFVGIDRNLPGAIWANYKEIALVLVVYASCKTSAPISCRTYINLCRNLITL